MTSKSKIKIAFIGGGNMGEALIAALVKKNIYKGSEIGVSDANRVCLNRLKFKYKIQTFTSNASMAAATRTLILAVKPQQMSSVLEEIKPVLKIAHLVISIAAGLDMSFFRKRLPPGVRVIRVMPNMCAQIGEGASAICTCLYCTPADKKLAKTIFEATGTVVFVDKEPVLDIVTAVSGSGPAFVFLFMEAILKEAEDLGLARETALPLLQQTLIGAAKMVTNPKTSITDLIQKVASKGGTTEAGLNVLSVEAFAETLAHTIRATAKRAEELRTCIS